MNKKLVAVRNLDLCTKDCVCLYVCPYGATDTENSIIDISKCTGCGLCAAACPSKAISMMPLELPPQQVKDKEVIKEMNKLSYSKARQEKIAIEIAEETDKEGLKKLMYAISKSNRIMGEDIIRESGYMLPQSKNSYEILEKLLKSQNYKDMPKETIIQLLKKIEIND